MKFGALSAYYLKPENATICQLNQRAIIWIHRNAFFCAVISDMFHCAAQKYLTKW
jgi:hypothetical protein